MKTFSTSGTGSGQTLSEIESGVIPCYDNETNLNSDLANLEENQIVATIENEAETTGNQYPVNVVESGNMHSVTSNAVAGAISGLSKKGKGYTVSTTTTVGWVNYINLGTLEAGKYAIITFMTGLDGLAIQSSSTTYARISSQMALNIITIASDTSVSIAGYSTVASRDTTVNALLLKVE